MTITITMSCQLLEPTIQRTQNSKQKGQQQQRPLCSHLGAGDFERVCLITAVHLSPPREAS